MDWLPPAPPSAPCWGSSPPPQRAPRLGIEGRPVGAWDDTHHGDTPAGTSIRFAVDSTLTSLKLSYLSCKLISLFKQMVCEQLPNAHSQPLPVRLHLGCKSLTHGQRVHLRGTGETGAPRFWAGGLRSARSLYFTGNAPCLLAPLGGPVRARLRWAPAQGQPPTSSCSWCTYNRTPPEPRALSGLGGGTEEHWPRG